MGAKEMEAGWAGERAPALSELNHMSPRELCSITSPFLESLHCPGFELWLINHTALSFYTCNTEFGVVFSPLFRVHSCICFINNKEVDRALKQEC